jgi:DNA-binding HxlR family transcriptional regulator
MKGYQERDQRILRTCYEQRVVPDAILRKYIFRDVSERMARRVLGRLEKSGLISRNGQLQIGSQRLIKLTKTGIRAAEAVGDIRVPQLRKLDHNTLVHDACVTAVRLRLEELWDGHWLSEAQLKADEFPQIPDGLWIFPNDNRVAIEVERSEKGPDRFHKLQERWRQVDVGLILYVTVGPLLGERVRRYIETGPSDLPFGVVDFEQLEAGTPKVWTRVKELDLLVWRSF